MIPTTVMTFWKGKTMESIKRSVIANEQRRWKYGKEG